MLHSNVHKHILGAALAALLVVGGAGCSKKNSGGDTGANSAATGGGAELARTDMESSVLRYPLGDDVKSLDPAIAYDSVSLTVMPLAMESLFQYNYLKTPLELEPLLAASMPTVSKDGKTYTIKLKKGVMWQDDAAFPNGKGRGKRTGCRRGSYRDYGCRDGDNSRTIECVHTDRKDVPRHRNDRGRASSIGSGGSRSASHGPYRHA